MILLEFIIIIAETGDASCTNSRSDIEAKNYYCLVINALTYLVIIIILKLKFSICFTSTINLSIYPELYVVKYYDLDRARRISITNTVES